MIHHEGESEDSKEQIKSKKGAQRKYMKKINMLRKETDQTENKNITERTDENKNWFFKE